MGGEGAQWIGIAPFTDVPHYVPEHRRRHVLPLRHAGRSAQAVAAGANITFKILYNGAVAMTGGQDAGRRAARARARPAAGRPRASRGSSSSRDDPATYRAAQPAAPGATSGTATGSTRPSASCATSPGVTVLIHDQQCAAEMRRQRKRGRLPPADARVVINEAVCEGCGDCGVKSQLPVVQPVDTEFGRKTQIHQSSLQPRLQLPQGRLPGVHDRVPGQGRRPRSGSRRHLTRSSIPASSRPGSPRVLGRRVRRHGMPGIGGTGVVTVSQMLAHGGAASTAARRVARPDRPAPEGRSRWCPTISDRRAPAGRTSSAPGSADSSSASTSWSPPHPQNLARARRGRTVAVVRLARCPDRGMVATSTRAAVPRRPRDRARSGTACRRPTSYVDARETVVGCFWRRPCSPTSSWSASPTRPARCRCRRMRSRRPSG